MDSLFFKFYFILFYLFYFILFFFYFFIYFFFFFVELYHSYKIYLDFAHTSHKILPSLFGYP